MKSLFSTLLILASYVNMYSNYTINGTVKDKEQQILSSITVTLLNSKDSSLVKGDISNKQGQFTFEGINEGEYIVACNAIGYKRYYSTPIRVPSVDNTTNLEVIMESSEKSIKEVKIANKKPLIEIKADKTVFNVEQSINATGTNALDLLRKSPGVRVDKDDNVSMRGKSNVLIYIDGKPSYLDQKDLAAMLKNMQSSTIESIELITNPSSRYDASGNAGIINIKLKKNKKLGTNGNVSAGLAYGKFLKEEASLNLNHRTKDVNLFGTYGFNNGKNFNYQNFDRKQNGFRYDFSSGNIDNSTTNSVKAGMDYYINSKSVIGLMGNIMNTVGTFNSTSKTYIGEVGKDFDKVLIASNRIPMKRRNITLNSNYKFEDTSGHLFNIDLDYGNYVSEGKSYQPNTYWNAQETGILSESIFRNFTPTTINIYSAKSDYEQNLWKGKLGIGIKSAYVKTDNDFQFYDVVYQIDTLNLSRSNHFVYIENVNAAYINYAKTFNKFSTQVGLRAEQTNSKGMLTSATPQDDDTVKRSYLNLFPSLGFTYTINAKNTIGLSYSRRIDRPNYQDLNPFENKLDELTYEKGNAFLRPQYTNSFDFTHTFMQFVTTSLNYSRTKDLFMQTTDTTEFSRTYVTQKNFASMDVAGINISFPVPVKKWWMIIANINANYNILKANFEGRPLSNKYYTYTFYADNTFTLPNDFSLNISGWYTGPNYWGGTFKMKPMGSLDIGVQKTFLNKKLTARLNLSDVFKTQAWYATSNFAGLYIDANGNWESRQLRMNLSYRFGNSSVQRQRERQAGSDSENKRIKSK